jgi:murein DD-endopeptidase MepM/ murein hydrolase activator NlpD
MNGVQVPEQHLNDTEVIAITKGITVKKDQANEIGLMQGFLTLPYRAENADQFWISNYFDNDIRLDFIRTYNGNTSNLQNRPNYLPGANVTGIGAQHPGVDFEGPRGNFVLSVAPGEIFWVGIDQVAILILDTYEAACGHMDHTLVPQGSPIYRGQIIGVNGVYNPSNPAQPTHPHIHFGLYILGHDNTPGADPYPVLGSADPYMDLIEKTFTRSQYINPEAAGYPSGTVGSMYFGSPGFWTTTNIPSNP